MDILGHLQPTQDELAMQQTRLQIIAENIAQAQTTRDVDGQPFQRREVVFSAFLDRNASAPTSRTELPRLQVEGIRQDDTPGQRVFQPGHPHADEEGYVTYPNVSISMEMVDLLQASRAYEANLQVVRTSRELAEKAMNISR